MSASPGNDTLKGAGTGQAALARVVFTPSGKRGAVEIGATVLQAARKLGVDLDSVCGGRGICGRCQVRLSEGAFAKHDIVSSAENLSPFSAVEQRYHDKRTPLAADRRLGCSTQIHGDVVIDVPPESQVHRQVVRKRAEARHIEVDPIVRLYYVEVMQPDMHDPSGDLRRLQDALAADWQLHDIDCDLQLLTRLQETLRQGQWKVTCAVHSNTLIAIWPGFKERVYGVAIDVGSTTIAAHLCDLTSGEVLASVGSMNPQIRFGEDLMSRVSYAMMNPGGEVEMTRVVRKAVAQLIAEATAEAGVAADAVLDVTLVGNPVMHHLLLGLNPVELGGAPFALAIDRALWLRASELELNTAAGTRAYVFPCVAGHVGADAAAVILSEGIYLDEALNLTVDVGTNAEIVLGNRARMLACSSPTGPAFEGAQISGGQRAAPGAIERVRIDAATLEPRFRVIGCDLWSDDSGFVEATSGIGVTGICGSGIIEVIAEMFLAGILSSDGVINGALTKRSQRIAADGRTFAYQLYDGAVCLRITQNDVRAIQLAKAALYAGIRLLMDRLQVDVIDRIRLAGAFGSHIDVKYAMVLGMIPDCDLRHVTSAGNAAGTGARIALLDRRARDEIESVVRRIEKIETAVEPKFQHHFIHAMSIPHRTAAFPQLAESVILPAPLYLSSGASAERRSNRRRAARTP